MLGGRYELADPLGNGGMAVVWRARDQVLGRSVAVKLLAGRHAGSVGARRRIRDEARAAALLSHPNIAQVYDYGEWDDDGTPLPYVVMELVRGVTLQQRQDAGPLSARFAMRITAEVAAALAAAHAEGLVHRDIKPANVMVTPEGAKVVDFGIAAAIAPSGAGESDGEVLGTPAYLAPERLIDDAVEPASDVYALGVLLYRLLSGESPWSADTTTQMLAAHIYVDPAPLAHLPGVPDYIIDLCNRCLSKDPTRRPSAREAAALLARGAGLRVVEDDSAPVTAVWAIDGEPSVLIRAARRTGQPAEGGVAGAFAPGGGAAAVTGTDPAQDVLGEAAWAGAADTGTDPAQDMSSEAAWAAAATGRHSGARAEGAGEAGARADGDGRTGPHRHGGTGSEGNIRAAAPAASAGIAAGAAGGPAAATATGPAAATATGGSSTPGSGNGTAPGDGAGGSNATGLSNATTPSNMGGATGTGGGNPAATGEPSLRAAAQQSPGAAARQSPPAAGGRAPGATRAAARRAGRARRRRLWTVAGAVAVVAVAVLAWLFVPGGRDDRAPAAARPADRAPAAGGPSAVAGGATGSTSIPPKPGDPPATVGATGGVQPPAGVPAGQAVVPGDGDGDGRTPAVTPGVTGPAGGNGNGNGNGGPTATPDEPDPTTDAPEPQERTLTSSGGTVRATCPSPGTAHLLSWSATKPYKVDQISEGPASAAVAVFKHGNRRARMTVTCTGGVPSTANDEP